MSVNNIGRDDRDSGDRVRVGRTIVSIAESKDVLRHPLLARWQLGVAGASKK